ncbi:MAG: RNA polymerase sporulation sigma factor SigK [Clostridia bacterium]|nr:RNA polymerase sporulation sigma factor SigK [Clostridia bacterium]
MWTWLLDSLSHLVFFALHLMTPGSFPRPLSAADERDALIAFHEQGDTAARSRLIEHNLRLVAHIVKKYASSAADQDDLISIGTIGLIKAVDTFDHTKGARLATYASRCIENEILMMFRANKKTLQDVSLSDPIDTDKDGHPLSLLDVIADEDTLAEDLELKVNSEQLHRYLYDVLDEREREVIVWRYGLRGDGLPQREVAKRLGISRSYISRIEKRALEKLRARFEQR